jgi:hypothetical protein
MQAMARSRARDHAESSAPIRPCTSTSSLPRGTPPPGRIHRQTRRRAVPTCCRARGPSFGTLEGRQRLAAPPPRPAESFNGSDTRLCRTKAPASTQGGAGGPSDIERTRWPLDRTGGSDHGGGPVHAHVDDHGAITSTSTATLRQGGAHGGPGNRRWHVTNPVALGRCPRGATLGPTSYAAAFVAPFLVLARSAFRWARYFLIRPLATSLCSEQTIPNTGAARFLHPGTGQY